MTYSSPTNTILREALYGLEESADSRVLIAQTLRAVANQFAYRQNDSDEMIISADDLLEAAYELLNIHFN